MDKSQHLKYESGSGSCFSHIYKVQPSPRGFLVEALLNSEEEAPRRASSQRPEHMLTSEHYKRVVVEFSIDDAHLSRLGLMASANSHKGVAKFDPDIQKA